MDDQLVIAKQLGKSPASPAVVAKRCGAGFPLVIKNSPRTIGRAPFPTLYWLTCPFLKKAVSRLESLGRVAGIETEIRNNPKLAAELVESDRAYRAARGAGDINAGIGGNRDIFHVKCLHAHTADYLAAGLNPVGRLVIQAVELPDGCRLCADE